LGEACLKSDKLLINPVFSRCNGIWRSV